MIKVIIVIGRKKISNTLHKVITELFKLNFYLLILKITMKQKNIASFLKHKNDLCG